MKMPTAVEISSSLTTSRAPARVKLLVASVMQPMADDSLHAKPL